MTTTTEQRRVIPTKQEADVLWEMAQRLYRGRREGMSAPRDCNTAEAFYAKMLAGAELNLPPMTSIFGLTLNENGVTMGSKVSVGLVRQRGIANIDLIESTAEHAVVRVHRNDWPAGETRDVAFTWADAKQAGLDGKEVYVKYARAMLAQRAYANAVNLYCQDATMGIGYTHEELGYEVDQDGELVGGGSDAAPRSLEPSGCVAEKPERAVGSGYSPGPAPAPSGDSSEPPAAEIKRLFQELGYSVEEWRLWLSHTHNISSIKNAAPEIVQQVLAHLQQLRRLRKLRASSGHSDAAMQKVLAKRQIDSELHLDSDDLNNILQKLGEAYTPFEQETDAPKGAVAPAA